MISTTSMKPLERLLLLQPRWMGDVLLCTPAIREARRAFPDAQIDFATESAGAEVLRNNPHLDQVLVDERTPRSRFALLREVARRRYDIVVDFRSTGSTAQIAFVSRARRRVGIRGRGPRNLAYTHLVDRLEIPTYAARHKLDMLALIGVPVQRIADLSLELPVGEEARRRAAEIWHTNALDGETVVAMSPISREMFKQWDVQRWAAVGDAIADRGARVLLTHAPGERERAREIVESMCHPPVWEFGGTSIEDVAAIFGRCDLWVGNDGGAKHIAVSAGTPTVMVSRWRIGPVWTDHTSAVRHVFIDRPPPQGCDMRCVRCPHRGCLGAVSTGVVIDGIRVALEAAAP